MMGLHAGCCGRDRCHRTDQLMAAKEETQDLSLEGGGEDICRMECLRKWSGLIIADVEADWIDEMKKAVV